MRKLIKLLAITAFAILVSAETEACSLPLTWEHSNTRVDGSALPNSEIKHFEIRCVGIGMRASAIKFAKSNTRGYDVKTSKAGRYSCLMITHDVWLLSSVPSNVTEGDCK